MSDIKSKTVVQIGLTNVSQRAVDKTLTSVRWCASYLIEQFTLSNLN